MSFGSLGQDARQKRLASCNPNKGVISTPNQSIKTIWYTVTIKHASTKLPVNTHLQAVLKQPLHPSAAQLARQLLLHPLERRQLCWQLRRPHWPHRVRPAAAVRPAGQQPASPAKPWSLSAQRYNKSLVSSPPCLSSTRLGVQSERWAVCNIIFLLVDYNVSSTLQLASCPHILERHGAYQPRMQSKAHSPPCLSLAGPGAKTLCLKIQKGQSMELMQGSVPHAVPMVAQLHHCPVCLVNGHESPSSSTTIPSQQDSPRQCQTLFAKTCGGLMMRVSIVYLPQIWRQSCQKGLVHLVKQATQLKVRRPDSGLHPVIPLCGFRGQGSRISHLLVPIPVPPGLLHVHIFSSYPILIFLFTSPDQSFSCAGRSGLPRAG